eukprot:7671605-Ditylum_brightwellii.AAC.1
MTLKKIQDEMLHIHVKYMYLAAALEAAIEKYPNLIGIKGSNCYKQSITLLECMPMGLLAGI